MKSTKLNTYMFLILIFIFYVNSLNSNLKQDNCDRFLKNKYSACTKADEDKCVKHCKCKGREFKKCWDHLYFGCECKGEFKEQVKAWNKKYGWDCSNGRQDPICTQGCVDSGWDKGTCEPPNTCKCEVDLR
jgi:hypothetical protein